MTWSIAAYLPNAVNRQCVLCLANVQFIPFPFWESPWRAYNHVVMLSLQMASYHVISWICSLFAWTYMERSSLGNNESWPWSVALFNITRPLHLWNWKGYSLDWVSIQHLIEVWWRWFSLHYVHFLCTVFTFFWNPFQIWHLHYTTNGPLPRN